MWMQLLREALLRGKQVSSGGGYSEGSLSWGWDYRDSFKPETIKALEKMSPLVLGDYEFVLTDRIVQCKKVKQSE